MVKLEVGGMNREHGVIVIVAAAIEFMPRKFILTDVIDSVRLWSISPLSSYLT